MGNAILGSCYITTEKSSKSQCPSPSPHSDSRDHHQAVQQTCSTKSSDQPDVGSLADGTEPSDKRQIRSGFR